MRIGRAVLALFVAAALAAGCGSGSGDDELLVFAATSLTDAMAEVTAAYEADTGGRVAVSYGPSQALAQQIASGAPADVFISAGVQPMVFLVERGHVADGAGVGLLTNSVVLVISPEMPQPASVEELVGDGYGRIALADPEVAPAGRYAKTAMQTLGVWDALLPKFVFARDVRSAVAYVQSGNADAAFVYQTDARIAPELTALDIVPADAYPRIVYPAAVITDADNELNKQAAAFVEYLRSDVAIEIFRKSGFTPLN